MKKSILTLLFVVSFLCIGALVAKADVRTASANSVKISKNSAAENEIKLKMLKSIIKNNESVGNQMCSGCMEMLSNLILLADLATSACGGPEGGNMGSWGCQIMLEIALDYGDYYVSQGCGFNSFNKAADKDIPATHPKMPMIRKEAVGIG